MAKRLLLAALVLLSAGPARAAPAKLPEGPRILAADSASAEASPPLLLVQTTLNGEEACSVLSAGAGGPGLAEIAISKNETAETIFVADLGYDAALKARAVAIESQDGRIQWAIPVGWGSPSSFQKTRDGRPFGLMVTQDANVVARTRARGVCDEVTFRPAAGGAPVTVSFLVSSEGDSKPVFAPRVRTAAGTVFKVEGGEPNSGDGPLRGFALSGYVSRDGKKVALFFRTRGIWTDSADACRYFYSQAFGPIGFLTLSKFGPTFPAAIPPGAATPRALEMRIAGEE
jgi:hypothetical protein